MVSDVTETVMFTVAVWPNESRIVTVHVPAETGVTVNVPLGPDADFGETLAIVC
jgi:hypothetical protein